MREKKLLGQERERLFLLEDHLTVFGVFLLVLILSQRKLWGFLLYGFLKENICVYCLLCLIDVLVILSIKDSKLMLA